MELQIHFFALLILCIAFFYLFTKHRSSSGNENLPPQPWKLPLLGHLHHLVGDLPHRALGNLAQKLGPIFHLKLGEVSAVVISSPALAKEVLKTHDLCFPSRPKILGAEIIGYNYTGIVFTPYGEYWRQMRKICILELLSDKKVRSFESIRDEESWSLIESIGIRGKTTSLPPYGSETINISEKIFSMMNAIAVRVSIGSKCKDQEKLLALIEEIISVSGGFDASDVFPSVKVLHLVADHQQHNATGLSDQNEDLLDVLLRIKDDGGLHFPLTSDNVKAVLLDMFVAGTDTSSVTIEWAMLELMKNPRVMVKAQAELRHVAKGKKKIHESDIQQLDYLKLVIKETLRLHPPAPLLIRQSQEKCDIGGYHIVAGTKVIINAWKIGCDADHWSDPESFDPERFNETSVNLVGTDFEFLPFGAGRRICPGMTLGLANVELPLARLLYHFNWELPSGVQPEDLDTSEKYGATLNLKHNLHLVPVACNAN
uniref:premnaspirodiene oxygenase-like isoform X2 n=1 Tax=Erigeron canadensis TaxID=72917 RepID=UPI001CB9A63D|nr:premnaspirodiene oxygenase-like isoform X2 [Erigeron canadensis]